MKGSDSSVIVYLDMEQRLFRNLRREKSHDL